MGTKNNPGVFDAYDKAEPDEPLFVLIGRDETAADFVELWADIHGANPIGAVQVFSRLLNKLKYIDVNRPKIMEAYRCSEEMKAYYTKRGFD